MFKTLSIAMILMAVSSVALSKETFSSDPNSPNYCKYKANSAEGLNAMYPVKGQLSATKEKTQKLRPPTDSKQAGNAEG